MSYPGAHVHPPTTMDRGLAICSMLGSLGQGEYFLSRQCVYIPLTCLPPNQGRSGLPSGTELGMDGGGRMLDGGRDRTAGGPRAQARQAARVPVTLSLCPPTLPFPVPTSDIIRLHRC